MFQKTHLVKPILAALQVSIVTMENHWGPQLNAIMYRVEP